MATLSALFGWATVLRAGLYRRGLLPRARLRGPVISVGNLSLGGSGKTPVVARIAEMLRDAGLPVSILSRGYRGSFRGEALIVGDGEAVLAGAAQAGDEPVMLARDLPGVVVAVGRRRDRVGRAVEARFGPRVHVLDDGFQHLRLARDLDLLCLDARDLKDKPLPAGRLREPLAAAARADIVLLTGDGVDLPSARERFGRERTLLLERRVEGFFALDGTPHLPPARPFLLSGIAKPERFAADVRSQVAEVVGGLVRPDHHSFNPRDLEEALDRARALGADALVTTAKDAVRLPSVPTPLPVLVLRISACIEDEESFRERLLAVARQGVALRPRGAAFQREDRAAAVAGRLASLLPRRAALALGRSLGRLLGDLDRRHVAIAVGNLRRAFPHWDERRLLRTARDVYAHFGQVLLDILWLRGRSREEVLSFFDVEGREHVEAAMAAGRGALLVTAHTGNWELHGVAHGWTFGPIAVVARPLDNPLLDRRLCEIRTTGGNSVIYKQRALAQILRALRAGQGVAILIDQNVQDGVFVDFFGRQAATTPVAAALAMKTGCALVPCHTEIAPDGRYRMVYEPPLTVSPSADREAEITRLTQELTRLIEGWVREVPEQWLWMHRRWKTRPEARTADTTATPEEAFDGAARANPRG